MFVYRTGLAEVQLTLKLNHRPVGVTLISVQNGRS